MLYLKIHSSITDPTPAPPLEGRGVPTESLQGMVRREPTPRPSRGGAGVGSVIHHIRVHQIGHPISEVMKSLCRNALKGQKALSPGQRPGYKAIGRFALKGQKPYLVHDAFALTGRWLRISFTQGDALGC